MSSDWLALQRQRALQGATRPSKAEAGTDDRTSTSVGVAADKGKPAYCAKFDAMFKETTKLELSSVSGMSDGVNASALDSGVFDDARIALKSDATQRNRVVNEVKSKLTSDSSSMDDPVIQGMIDAMMKGQDNIDLYQQIVAGFTTYFQSVTDVMSRLPNYIKVTTDGDGKQTVRVDTDTLKADLMNNVKDMSVSVPREQAAAWRAELSPIFDVSDDGVVSVNQDHLNAMLDACNTDLSGVDMAAYQAWETGFSAEKDNIQNDLQTIVEKYSHQNSNFDSMVKVLSGSIETLTETAKAFLQI
ncbi:hypothetical protein WS62_29810 [Burkholderia sp. ABCPW 14]|nr:hypothetical protein WS62_29810 [Burkholderia sp. ABCPW 14]